MNPIFIADQVMKKFDLIFYGVQFWCNRNGCYVPAEMEIRNFLQSLLKNKFSSHNVKEILFALESKVYKEQVDSEPNFINFKNGIYDWSKKEFCEHGKRNDLKFMNQIPVNFNKNAEYPKIQKFLSEVVSEEDQKVLLQFLGYCLIPTTQYEKAMMLVGDGANGKSTLLKVIIALIGGENSSTLSLFDLSHRFRLAEIVGKLVNIYPDLPNKKLMESSIFKALVAGDPITAERKYSKPFTFRSFAKLIFSTNKLPPTYDISPAFFRRWLIIEFPNAFYGKKRDTKLLSKLTTQEELEGLLQLAIKGLHTLNDTGDFHTSERMGKIISEYERVNNPVTAFIEEKCIIALGAEIKKVELYAAYQLFVFDEKLTALGRNEFAKELKRHVPALTEVHDTSKRWRGIDLIK